MTNENEWKWKIKHLKWPNSVIIAIYIRQNALGAYIENVRHLKTELTLSQRARVEILWIIFLIFYKKQNHQAPPKTYLEWY